MRYNYAGGGYIMNNFPQNPSAGNLRTNSLMQYMRPQQMNDSDIGDEEMEDPNVDTQNAYAKGGRVNQHPSSLTEFIRQQGRNGDTVLAHINPIEAHILKSIGGSGTINPNTGLPEFFKKPKWVKKAQKWMAGSAGGGIGAVVGNMIMPGIGGVIGGALGGAAGSAVRGRKDYMQAGLRGAAMGAMLPTAAGLVGTGANAMGATNVGHELTKYGNINAVLPSIGFGGESSGVGSYMSPAMNAMGGSNQSPMQYLPQQEQQYQYSQNPYVDNRSFGDKLSGNMKDYFTQPGNLLTLGTAAAQYMGRPKPVRPKTPEQLADEERRYRNASRMTAAEVEAEEELNAVRKNATKRHKDAIINQELANIGQLHRKVNSPEEYAQRGQWLEYYDNPQFAGERIRMKAGGQVHSPHSYLIEQETIYPGSLMGYIRGVNGGQDDDVNAMLSNGEYVIDASTVADLGDGNNEAGARKLDAFRERVRKHKRGGSINLPPKSKSLLSYMRG